MESQQTRHLKLTREGEVHDKRDGMSIFKWIDRMQICHVPYAIAPFLRVSFLPFAFFFSFVFHFPTFQPSKSHLFISLHASRHHDRRPLHPIGYQRWHRSPAMGTRSNRVRRVCVWVGGGGLIYLKIFLVFFYSEVSFFYAWF